MGVIINSWSEVLLRYPELDKLAAVSSSAVNTPTAIAANQAGLIAQAEAYIHGKLSTNFTTPFSSNNYTAKDLVIDAVYVQNILSRQAVKGKTVATYLDEKISALCTGRTQMVTIAGTIAQLATGDPTWSSTMNYQPTFGMENPVMWAVSSQMMIDENNARGNLTDEAY